MSAPDRAEQRAREAAPYVPASWLFVARSRDVVAGRVASVSLGGRDVVAFRDRYGEARLLDAYCPHMGAHLGGGALVEGCIRCPLHHRLYDASGACVGAAVGDSRSGSARLAAFPARERLGVVFGFPGSSPRLSLDDALPRGAGATRFRMGRPVELRCAWQGVVANAFDVQHLSVVHGRRLVEPPEVVVPDPYRFELRYRARVTGSGLADRAMRRLSGDDVRVTIACVGGTTISVESLAGRHRASLLLAVAPRGERTVVVPFAGVPRGRSRVAAAVRVAAASWLYERFLRRDVAVLDRMRFAPRPSLPADEVLARFLDYLAALPRASAVR